MYEYIRILYTNNIAYIYIIYIYIIYIIISTYNIIHACQSYCAYTSVRIYIHYSKHYRLMKGGYTYIVRSDFFASFFLFRLLMSLITYILISLRKGSGSKNTYIEIIITAKSEYMII